MLHAGSKGIFATVSSVRCPNGSSRHREGGRPIDDKRDGLRRFLCNHIDQKPLTVGRNVPTTKLRADFEQGLRGGDFKLWALAVYLNRHEFSIGCKVENLVTVLPPSWTYSPGRGDLPLATRTREWSHVHFESSGVVRLVDNRATVG